MVLFLSIFEQGEQEGVYDLHLKELNNEIKYYHIIQLLVATIVQTSIHYKTDIYVCVQFLLSEVNLAKTKWQISNQVNYLNWLLGQSQISKVE